MATASTATSSTPAASTRTERALASVCQRRYVRAAAAGLVVASLLDLATTFVGLRVGLVESNPLAASVLHATGFFGFIIVKAGVVGVLLGALGAAHYSVRGPRFVEGGLLGGVVIIGVLWGAISGWNTALIAHAALAPVAIPRAGVVTRQINTPECEDGDDDE